MLKRKSKLNPKARRTVIAWSIIATILFGPYLLWNVGNLFGLYPDMLELFARKNVRVIGLYCAMDGMSRSATCTFYASDEQIQKLIQGYKLKKLSPDQVHDDERFERCNCSISDTLTKHKSVESYGIYGRPKELDLLTGGGFDYLIIHRYPHSNITCVSVCYAYG